MKELREFYGSNERLSETILYIYNFRCIRFNKSIIIEKKQIHPLCVTLKILKKISAYIEGLILVVFCIEWNDVRYQQNALEESDLQ